MFSGLMNHLSQISAIERSMGASSLLVSDQANPARGSAPEPRRPQDWARRPGNPLCGQGGVTGRERNGSGRAVPESWGELFSFFASMRLFSSFPF